MPEGAEAVAVTLAATGVAPEEEEEERATSVSPIPRRFFIMMTLSSDPVR